MAKGVVRKFNQTKGYGFIVSEENNNQDIFFHYSAIDQKGFKTVQEGQEVEFDLVVHERGPQARNIHKL